jgi:hypothetical protein
MERFPKVPVWTKKTEVKKKGEAGWKWKRENERMTECRSTKIWIYTKSKLEVYKNIEKLLHWDWLNADLPQKNHFKRYIRVKAVHPQNQINFKIEEIPKCIDDINADLSRFLVWAKANELKLIPNNARLESSNAADLSFVLNFAKVCQNVNWILRSLRPMRLVYLLK